MPNSRKYSLNLRKFALSLHFYSVRAYNFVCYKFYNVLPHAKTISKWYRSIDGEVGILTEALNTIKLHTQSVSYRLIGALYFDEMTIRQHIDYYKGRFIGYIDCGNYIECDSTKVAEEALVFCVVCINQAWKIPVAYYLINGMTTEQKRNLTLQCLAAIQETGMLVVSLTCDGLQSNLIMLQSLGCNFTDPTKLQTWFKHPASVTNVYVFLDPSHMLKLVRNIIGKVKILYDADGNKIEWKYFEELHKLQEAEGLHLANKIRSKHIAFYKNKIKVKLASQLLSMSVAHSFLFCENTLQKPISIETFSEIITKVKDCAEYIRELSLPDGQQNILHSRVKTGFLGFLVNIQSMIQVYKFACVENNMLKYIPMYKISQDHLELIFESIRSQGGYNNNPTIIQFKSALKKLIIHIDIREKSTGNCINLEDIPILHVSSVQNSVNIINKTVNSNKEWLDILHTVEIDHDYSFNMCPMNTKTFV